jgi:hypothetical protein
MKFTKERIRQIIIEEVQAESAALTALKMAKDQKDRRSQDSSMFHEPSAFEEDIEALLSVLSDKTRALASKLLEMGFVEQVKYILQTAGVMLEQVTPERDDEVYAMLLDLLGN